MSGLEQSIEELSIGSMPFEVIKGEIFGETASASNGLEVAVSLLNGTKKQLRKFQEKLEEGLNPKNLEKHYKKLLLYFDVFDASIDAIGSFSDNPMFYRASDEQVNEVLKEGIKYFRFNLNSTPYELPSGVTEIFREATDFIDRRLQDLGLMIYKNKRLIQGNVAEELIDMRNKIEELHKILDPDYKTEMEQKAAIEEVLEDLFVDPVDPNKDPKKDLPEKEIVGVTNQIPETSVFSEDKYAQTSNGSINGNGAICLGMDKQVKLPAPPIPKDSRARTGDTDPLFGIKEMEAVPATITEEPPEVVGKLEQDPKATIPYAVLSPIQPPPPVPEHMKSKIPPQSPAEIIESSVEPLDPSELTDLLTGNTAPTTPAPIITGKELNHPFYLLLNNAINESGNLKKVVIDKKAKSDTRSLSVYLIGEIMNSIISVIKDYHEKQQEKPIEELNKSIDNAKVCATALLYIKDKVPLIETGYEITQQQDGSYTVTPKIEKPVLPNQDEQAMLILEALRYSHKDLRGIPVPLNDPKSAKRFLDFIDNTIKILESARTSFQSGDYREGILELGDIYKTYRSMQEKSEAMDQRRKRRYTLI